MGAIRRAGHVRAVASALVVFVATIVASAPAGGTPTTEGAFLSSEVYTTSTSCSNTAALRAAADLLDDEWRAVARADSYELGTLPAPADPTPNPTSFTIGSVTAEISKHDVDDATALSVAPSSWGTVDVAGTNDPETATSANLQDCAPIPASLYSSTPADRTPLWRATAGDGSTLDAVMVRFSTPVAAFGTWIGDLETRQDDGVAARLKLFDAAGNVITNEAIPTDRPTPLPSDPSGRTECGGTQAVDALACGNQATRFIGFAYEQPVVSAMLLIVGDDDSCTEQPTSCSGHTEHLSLIGPQLAVYETGELTVNKTAVGGTATDPWRFEVIADNGCPLPESPYVRDVVPAGGSVTFEDLPATLDGQTACLYSLVEQPVTDWTLDTTDSDPMTGLTVESSTPTVVEVVNRFVAPAITSTMPTTETTASSSTSAPATTPSTGPASTTSTTANETTTTLAATGGAAGGGQGSTPTQSGAGATLPRTGAESGVGAAVGAGLLAVGALLASGHRLGLPSWSSWQRRMLKTSSSR